MDGCYLFVFLPVNCNGMTGIEISKKTSLLLFYGAASCVIFSLAMGIIVGPTGILIASGLGLSLSIIDGTRRMTRHQSALLPTVMFSTHILFLLAAGILAFFFLAPLPDASLRIPKLTQRHTDLDGSSQVRLPEGWLIDPLRAAQEVGVRAHPADRSEYMGVAEVTVRVRILDKKQKANEDFFKKMASTLSLTPQQKKRLFEFKTKPAILLNGDSGLWSYLVLKRFWVPLYQTSIFGLQKGRYLCSVAASGLKSHDKLAEVLCLGVMQSIQMTENAEKTP